MKNTTDSWGGQHWGLPDSNWRLHPTTAQIKEAHLRHCLQEEADLKAQAEAQQLVEEFQQWEEQQRDR